MNKILFVLILLKPVFAEFQTKNIIKLTAFVKFGSDTTPPTIIHTPVTQIPSTNKIAKIQGTATDDLQIATVNLYYKKETEISFSTLTITPQGGATYYFEFIISSITENINYRIEASDTENYTFIPTSYSWLKIELITSTSAIIGNNGGKIIFDDGNPSDGTTSIEIPPDAVDSETTITIKWLDSNSVADGNYPAISIKPLVAFQFLPEGLIFKKPVKITLLYQDLDNDGKVDGTDFYEKDLSLFWYDGFEWRNLGGILDIAQNTVSTYITHFSIYAIFPIGKLFTDDYKPKEKIITPSLKGNWDTARFDGLDSKTTTIYIFDINGTRIKKIEFPPYEWNGTDEDSKIVESGIYIYQFKVDNKLVTGLIVVAK